jgi:ABC-type methionine transport system permease subunit
MLQTILGVAAVVVPIALAMAGWMRAVEHRLDKLEQGQIGMSLQLGAVHRGLRRLNGDPEE